jgi:hypothetical protein
MADHILRETLANWAADFAGGDRMALFPPDVQAVAQEALETLLVAACARRGVQPGELDQEDLKHALLAEVARFAFPAAAKPFVPSLCRAYLEDLQRQGRLGAGQALGRYVGALKEAFMTANPGKAVAFKRAGEKLGRNDLCPCGSGRKYKKCHGA